MARLHVEGTAFDASGHYPEQIITVLQNGNGLYSCQTSIPFPQLAYSDSQTRLADTICHSRKRLPADCFDSVSSGRVFYPFTHYGRYTSIVIQVDYDETMQPNAVCVDTTEAQMTEQFSFGTKKMVLRAPPGVRKIRDLGAKLIAKDPDASYSDMNWTKQHDEKTNTRLMCEANLAALHYFKHVGANLIARRSNLGGSHVFAPLIKSPDSPFADSYDMLGHTVAISPDKAVDLFAFSQRMRAEYLKLTNLSKMDGQVNAVLLQTYREKGAGAVSEKDIARVSRRLNMHPKGLKL